MITVDYSNYNEQQAEWANGLMRASRHVLFQRPGKQAELTLLASDILRRLTKRGQNETVTFQD